ncbi:MAG: hypothetical protein ABEJ82_03330 [Haloplanus sp.]
MSLTRRGALSLFALAQSNLLGGCFGNSDADGGSSSGGGSTSTTTPTATPTATETETPTETATRTPKPVRNEALARATGRIGAEFEWLASDYQNAIRGFRVASNAVLTAIDALDVESGLTQEDVDPVETKTTAVADYVSKHLAAHFDVAPALTSGNNVYVQSLQRTIERSDEDAQRSTLARMRLFYQRVGTNEYIANEFSRKPAYDALYARLVPNSEDRIVAVIDPDGFRTWAYPDKTDSTATDGVDHHVHTFDGGQRYFTHAHPYDQEHMLRSHQNEPPGDVTYGYADGRVDLMEDTEQWRDRMDDYEAAVKGVFEPVKSDGRSRALYCFVSHISNGFVTTPLYVESFDSAAAAQSAVEASLDAEVTALGTETFGGRDWVRTVYDAGDVTLYAYRIRAGAHVVTAAPARDVWDQRPDWNALLKPTWLGVSPSA